MYFRHAGGCVRISRMAGLWFLLCSIPAAGPLCAGRRATSGLTHKVSCGGRAARTPGSKVLAAMARPCLSQGPAASPLSAWLGLGLPGMGLLGSLGRDPAPQQNPPGLAWPGRGLGQPCCLFPGRKEKRAFPGFVHFKMWISRRRI